MLKKYIGHLEITCYDKRNFELIVAIPDNDKEHDLFLKISEETSIELKIVRISFEFLNAMKGWNLILKEVSDQNTYFYIGHSDRCRFSSKNWDLILKQYINTVPDDMFFLRGSNFSKHMKFRNSVQEAYYYPEQWAVYTRKYLEAIEGFPEFHTGHDGALEMIQYFINKNTKDPYRRDILMPNIMHSDIKTIPSKDTTGGKERFYERYYINNFFYKSYFSKKALEVYNKYSKNIFLNHIIWLKKFKNSQIIQIKKKLAIKLEDGKITHKESYSINFVELIKEKIFYLYGINHGFNFAHRFYFIIKYDYGFFIMKKIVFFFNSHIQRTKDPSISKYEFLLSSFYKLLAKTLTTLFFTEPISNEVEGLFRGTEFKRVLHSEKIKEAYKKNLYKKSLEQISSETKN